MESFISALIYFHNGVLHISTIDMWELFHLHCDLSASPPLCSCCQTRITGCLRSSRSFLPHLFCPIEQDLYMFRQSVCRQSSHHLDHHHHHLCAASPLAAALPNLHHTILYRQCTYCDAGGRVDDMMAFQLLEYQKDSWGW